MKHQRINPVPPGGTYTHGQESTNRLQSVLFIPTFDITTKLIIMTENNYTRYSRILYLILQET